MEITIPDMRHQISKMYLLQIQHLRRQVHIRLQYLLIKVFITIKPQKMVRLPKKITRQMLHQRRIRLGKQKCLFTNCQFTDCIIYPFLMQSSSILFYYFFSLFLSIFFLCLILCSSVALKQLSAVRSGVQQALSLSRNDSTLSANSRESSRKDNKNTQASR